MTKIVTLLCAVAVLAVGTSFAGEGCCASKKSKADAKSGECAGGFSNLKLTEDQQSKIAELKATCDKEGCSKASREKFMKGLEGILTAEQFAQVKEHCAKEGKSGCSMKKDAPKS